MAGSPKRFGQQESVLDLMFWLALSTTLLATPLALLDWRPLPAETWWGFLGVAVCGLLNGLCWLTALKRLDALVMTTLSYLALPCGFAAAMLVFGERPALATWLGAGLVLLAVAMLGYGERRFRLLALAITPDGAAVPRP